MQENHNLLIRNFNYSKEGLESFQKDLSTYEKRLMLDYPTVYMVNNQQGQKRRVYVGEANNILKRTNDHLSDKSDKLQEVKDGDVYVIGDEKFNKSVTMDIENKFIEYFLSSPKTMSVELLNGRSNPQPSYAGKDDANLLFQSAVEELHQRDRELFPKLEDVASGAIFKASPFKKLTTQQQNVKSKIFKMIIEQQKSDEIGQLLLVEGSAGTGKTVLLSSLFYDLASLDPYELIGAKKKLKIALVVNHEEQLKVYRQIVKKLNSVFGDDEFIIAKPTQLINHFMKTEEKYDVVLVDEAHLLWTMRQQRSWTPAHEIYFNADNQIDALRQLTKSLVTVFDPDQILRTDQSWNQERINVLEDSADQIYSLDNQMRMKASQEVVTWIDDFVNGKLTDLPRDSNYDLKVFSSASDLFDAIKEKDAEFGLSRMLSTYDWTWKSKPPINGTWNVTAGDLEMPWNYTKVKLPANISWAEYPETIAEIGSTFTIQGFDLNYAGLILGPSIQYRNGQIVIDENYNKSKQASKGRHDEKSATVVKHLRDALNVLMKRGVKGLYLYAVDDELRNALLYKQIN